MRSAGIEFVVMLVFRRFLQQPLGSPQSIVAKMPKTMRLRASHTSASSARLISPFAPPWDKPPAHVPATLPVAHPDLASHRRPLPLDSEWIDPERRSLKRNNEARTRPSQRGGGRLVKALQEDPGRLIVKSMPIKVNRVDPCVGSNKLDPVALSDFSCSGEESHVAFAIDKVESMNRGPGRKPEKRRYFWILWVTAGATTPIEKAQKDRNSPSRRTEALQEAAAGSPHRIQNRQDGSRNSPHPAQAFGRWMSTPQKGQNLRSGCSGRSRKQAGHPVLAVTRVEGATSGAAACSAKSDGSDARNGTGSRSGTRTGTGSRAGSGT